MTLRFSRASMSAICLASLLASVSLAISSAPAAAQSGCDQGQKLIEERQGIVKRINGLGKKNVDARRACPLFRNLASNGERLVKWATDNKDWCRVPDEFIDNMTREQTSIVRVRGQACTAAAKMEKLQREAARQQREGAQSGLLGGGGVDPYTAPVRIPQGAL